MFAFSIEAHNYCNNEFLNSPISKAVEYYLHVFFGILILKFIGWVLGWVVFLWLYFCLLLDSLMRKSAIFLIKMFRNSHFFPGFCYWFVHWLYQNPDLVKGCVVNVFHCIFFLESDLTWSNNPFIYSLKNKLCAQIFKSLPVQVQQNQISANICKTCVLKITQEIFIIRHKPFFPHSENYTYLRTCIYNDILYLLQFSGRISFLISCDSRAFIFIIHFFSIITSWRTSTQQRAILLWKASQPRFCMQKTSRFRIINLFQRTENPRIDREIRLLLSFGKLIKKFSKIYYIYCLLYFRIKKRVRSSNLTWVKREKIRRNSNVAH